MEKILLLFDVDGTLTPARSKIKDDMKNLLFSLSNNDKFDIGFVGGSDFVKQREQLGEDVLDFFYYMFPDNGMIAYKNGKLTHKKSILDFIGDEEYKELVDYCLEYISKLDIPKKRGTFIQLRPGLLNISPIGRNCSTEERLEFLEFDKLHKIREKMIEALKIRFPNLKLQYSIGGQISFDVFPIGLDKSYCLNHISNENYDKIHFFGDKTYEGGNDYEIFIHPDVEGHTVESPEQTIEILKRIIEGI